MELKMSWILVIFIYQAGMGPVTMSSIPDFTTKEECVQAGKDSEHLVAGLIYREISTVCLSRSKS